MTAGAGSSRSERPPARPLRGAPPRPPAAPEPVPERPGPLGWAGRGRRVVYRGPLAGRPGLRLHLGFDGWEGPVRDVAFQLDDAGQAVAELPDPDGHLVVDCTVRTDGEWDNNGGADYRLWLGWSPIDSHLHAMHAGWDRLGFAALETGLSSAGIGTGIISWRDNQAVDRLVAGRPWLRQLVWVVPGRTPVAEVRRRLAAGHVGLKLHPSHDRFPADDRRLDPYLELAAEAGVPVAVHSAPGNADPDRIRCLAERFGSVPVVLYHTYLGPPWGRRRAARHAQRQPNLYLETSWCGSREVLRLVDEVGPDRVLFGSDAAVDGPWHFVQRPPNVEGRQTYNQVLVAVARGLGPAAARKVLRDNTSRLFGLTAGARPGSG
jgi:Tat protein secretion system quality control protein TatD with DNase activity